MKSYSGIPYTTGKQAADDVKTQLVGFIKIPKWLLGLCLITVFYILFVCFSMYKIGDSTTQLYEYPYTVSRKAQEMKTALYGIRISLPSLLATPDITAAQINDLLRKQRAMQDKSLEEITLKFRGNEKELAYLKRCMAELREARKNMVNNLLGNLDFQYINAYYAREVLPHFEKVDKLLGNLGDAAEHRGNVILAEMDKLRTFSIIATLLMGISIILLILHTRKLEWDKYKVPLPKKSKLTKILDSSELDFGGDGDVSESKVSTKRVKVPSEGKKAVYQQAAEISLKPLSVVYYKIEEVETKPRKSVAKKAEPAKKATAKKAEPAKKAAQEKKTEAVKKTVEKKPEVTKKVTKEEAPETKKDTPKKEDIKVTKQTTEKEEEQPKKRTSKTRRTKKNNDQGVK